MTENSSKLAHKLVAGDTVEIHPRDWVTVKSVDRNDPRFISNGHVYLTGTNGQRYGIDRNRTVSVR